MAAPKGAGELSCMWAKVVVTRRAMAVKVEENILRMLLVALAMFRFSTNAKKINVAEAELASCLLFLDWKEILDLFE